MVVFGTGSFLLNACKPSQVGMHLDHDKEYIIERRQRYFHLFWIPAFSIGKIWAMRSRKDNELYEPNALVEQALNALPFKEKTPWYTYALPLLILAATIIVPAFMSANRYLSERRYAARVLEKTTRFEALIKSPVPFQYFVLEGNDSLTYLKHLAANDKSLKCVRRTVAGSSMFGIKDPLKVFADSASDFDTVSVTKDNLLKCLNREDNNSFEGYPIFPDGKYTINDIQINDYPAFVFLKSGFENGKYYAQLKNIGTSGTFSEFTKRRGNLELSPIATKINEGEYLTIEGKFDGLEPELNGKLTLLNNANTKLYYSIVVYGSKMNINFTSK